MKRTLDRIVIVMALVVGAPLLVMTVIAAFTLPPAPAAPPAPAPATPSAPPATPHRITLVVPSGGNALVWHDDAALNEAMGLLDAGVQRTHPELLARLLACRVSSGTAIIVTNGGFFSSTVLVTAGSQAGCRGVIANDFVVRSP